MEWVFSHEKEHVYMGMIWDDITCNLACFPNQYAKASLPGTRKSHLAVNGNIISTESG